MWGNVQGLHLDFKHWSGREVLGMLVSQWLIASECGEMKAAPFLQLEMQSPENRGDPQCLEERLLCLTGSGHCVFTEWQTHTSDNRTGSTVSAAGRGENCVPKTMKLLLGLFASCFSVL